MEEYLYIGELMKRYTVVKPNKLDKTKMIVSHFEIQDKYSLKDILIRYGFNSDDCIIFEGRHDRLLPEEL